MRFYMILTILFITSVFAAYGEQMEKIIDLRGQWKFEIGDDLKWAKTEFDDRSWEEINVPSNWEDEGFPGYDGFAWYRFHFTPESWYEERNLFLMAGQIDDVDEIYFNGHMIGHTGTFPPHVETMYGTNRRYFIPAELINKNKDNVIAVRVYDDYGVGGIIRGNIGVYAVKEEFIPDLPLSGTWKFKTGDSLFWKEENLDDENWMDVFVPSFWAAWGLKDYDGFGWYRKKFRIPEHLKDEKLILYLGRIDDYDVTYINGHQIGKTGNMNRLAYNTRDLGDYYLEYRAYYIPNDYLDPYGENVIAVRVYDGMLHGGIYADAPVGIITWERYLHWRQEFKTDKLKTLFDFLFGD